MELVQQNAIFDGKISRVPAALHPNNEKIITRKIL